MVNFWLIEQNSKVSTSASSFPIIEPSGLKSFDFESIFFRNIIACVWEFFETVHRVIFIFFKAICRYLSVFVWRIFLNHSFRINCLNYFFRFEIFLRNIFSHFCFLILNFKFWISVSHRCRKLLISYFK